MATSLNIVLYQPVIPQNTGSIARLCACTGARLHLIHPLGFQLDDAAVKRAGLDYWPYVDISSHASWADFCATERPSSLFFFSKFSKQSYTSVSFPEKTYLVFGNETTGLPDSLRVEHPSQFLQVPMRTHLVRSLNLAQCAAVVAYEFVRQHGLPAMDVSPAVVRPQSNSTGAEANSDQSEG